LAGDGTGHDVGADELGELLRLLASSDVEELELEQDDARLVIRREPRAGDGGGRTGAVPAAEPDVSEPFVVTAPMVGIFRRSAGGKAEPPLNEGDSVTAGQVVGAVEAMRMLNRVQSERAGVVARLLVHEGQPVEYGQPLLELRPSPSR
jgi:acetyl-CoA carboxylase biotin carboxyl carrier protein